MITYKMFHPIKRRLYAWNNHRMWKSYYKTFINVRADGYGPFACFKSLDDLKAFASGYEELTTTVVYKVRIKRSKDSYLWDGEQLLMGREIPRGTIFADEFEILEQIK